VIAVIDSGVSNIGSVLNMLAKLRIEHRVAPDADSIGEPNALLLPGVGAFDAGMAALEQRGLVEELRSRVAEGTPLLGICLGMQLLARRSDEGTREGLGVLAADVVRLDPASAPGGRVPHMGWNRITVTQPGGILPDDPAQRFYFVHSYHVVCDEPAEVLATVDYGGTITAAAQRGAAIGLQFHPEKSHRFGMAVLERYGAVVGSR
jgi:glutamine amidotransferase